MQRVVLRVVEEEPEEDVCARGQRPLRWQQCSICQPLTRSLVEAGGEAPQAIEGVWCGMDFVRGMQVSQSFLGRVDLHGERPSCLQ